MFLRGKSECILRFHAKFSSPNNKQNFWKFKHTCISREIRLRPRYYFRAKREFVSFPCVAIVLDPISEIFEQKEIRFPYDTIRYNFADYDSLCTILPYAKNECFTNFLLLSLSFFFSKKTRGQHFNDSVAKKEEKEGRGGPLIVFIFT